MTSALLIDSVWKAFGERPVLKGATVWADPGRICLLLGGNGSGKSTLLRCALGAVRWNRGGVFIDGTPVPPRLATLSRQGLFYWPDEGLLSRRRTIGWHLAMVRREGTAATPHPADARVAEFADRLPDELSAGERRRCELAVVEAARPRFLLADEPLLGTSPTERAALCQALRRLAAGGCAVLVTGHEVEDLLAVADDVIWMVAGTTHALGQSAEARANWHFRRDYLAGRARI